MNSKSKQPPGIFPVILVVLVDLIGFGIVLPLLPYYAKTLGATAFETGFLFSIYSIAQMFASPIWGRWSDRVGRRPVMLISTLGASLAYLAFAFSHTYWLLFASRLLAGVMGGNIAAAQAYVADVTAPQNRAKGMGMIGAAFGIGFTLGPAIAALLLQVGLADRPYLFPGLFAAGMSILSFAFVLFRLPESKAPGTPVTPARPGPAIWQKAFWKGMIGLPGGMLAIIPMLLAASWLMAFAQSSLYGAFPLFCAARYGLTVRGTSGLYVLTGAVAILVQGGLIRVLVKRFTEASIFMVGSIFLATGLLMMPWMNQFVAFAGFLALMTLGASLCGPTLTSLLSQEAGAGQTGETLGRAQGMAGLGRAAGPAWGGWLYDQGATLPFVLTGIISIQAIFMGARLTRGAKHMNAKEMHEKIS
jgi:multidrug resistance protein